MAVAQELTDQEWADLFQGTKKEACHLEMRDWYGVGDEVEMFADFRGGRPWTYAAQARHRAHWLDLVRATTGRGVSMRRARIVSEPVSEYIAFEHAGTCLNVDAGEAVRWLPRPLASGIALPGNDLWLFDGDRVLFNLFSGDGAWAGCQLVDDPAVVELSRNAFAAVWAAAIPHESYQIS
jgi:hypothetical protein